MKKINYEEMEIDKLIEKIEFDIFKLKSVLLLLYIMKDQHKKEQHKKEQHKNENKKC